MRPGSPRFVSPEVRRRILGELKGVLRVAVAVNPSPEEAESILEEGFDLIQLHGEEEYGIAERVGPEKVIKVFRVKDKPPLIESCWKRVHAVLLDTYSPQAVRTVEPYSQRRSGDDRSLPYYLSGKYGFHNSPLPHSQGRGRSR